MAKYYLKYRVLEDDKFNAGSKAVNDCNSILESIGYKPFFIDVKRTNNKIKKSFQITKLNKLSNLSSSDVIIIPHPIGFMHRYIDVIHRVHRRKKFKICYLIHDFSTLRFINDRGVKHVDDMMLQDADFIIAHNNSMSKYIKDTGTTAKVVNLNIFDYLGSENINKKKKSCTLNVAGQLAESKAQYIYNINNLDEHISLFLYGANFNASKIRSPKVKYFGKFPPEDIPKVFSEGFGLIWDGPSIETCGGYMGNYLKYNNPHKLSLYLSAGLPVVVWEKSAIKEFVLENNVGITVNNINEFYEKYQKITDQDYQLMCHNADQIAEKLHHGYYLKSVIGQIENYLN